VRSAAIALAVLGGLGAFLAGIWTFGITQPTYSECQSGLIAALDQGQCQQADTFHALGLMAFIACVAVVVVSLIYGAVKGPDPAPPPGTVPRLPEPPPPPRSW
jgi:hypothetical protein